ncbi:MAG: hypothetical protein ACRD7E_03555 [Bryobacteraceae bacterium]
MGLKARLKLRAWLAKGVGSYQYAKIDKLRVSGSFADGSYLSYFIINGIGQ